MSARDLKFTVTIQLGKDRRIGAISNNERFGTGAISNRDSVDNSNGCHNLEVMADV